MLLLSLYSIQKVCCSWFPQNGHYGQDFASFPLTWIAEWGNAAPAAPVASETATSTAGCSENDAKILAEAHVSHAAKVRSSASDESDSAPKPQEQESTASHPGDPAVSVRELIRGNLAWSLIVLS